MSYRYWKGYSSLDTSQRVVACIYDVPKTSLFSDESVLGHVVYLTDGHNEEISDDSDLSIRFSGIRPISEDEFTLQRSLAVLSTEIFLDQYTGGFPRSSRCASLLKDIRHNLRRVLNSSPSGAWDREEEAYD